MKTFILILLVFIVTNSFAQNWNTSPYRTMPRKGEIISIVGIAIIALPAVNVIDFVSSASTPVTIIGAAISCAGVYISVNEPDNKFMGKHKSNRKIKRQTHKTIFASGNRIGLRINF